MHARAMNFKAYGNRALIANEVLVAQMVSLSSWAQYAQTHAENLPTQFPECADYTGWGALIGAAFHYNEMYAIMCYATVQYAGQYIQQMAKMVPSLAFDTVTAVEANKQAIQKAHNLLHARSYLQSIRRSVMQDVAQANYAGDGSVKVLPLGPGIAVALTDDLDGFTQSYTGKDRGRMAELAVYAAHSDRFTKERVWTAEAEVPGPDEICIARERKSEVRRRGGTELVNYDEWIAEDTESFWRAQRRVDSSHAAGSGRSPLPGANSRPIPRIRMIQAPGWEVRAPTQRRPARPHPTSGANTPACPATTT